MLFVADSIAGENKLATSVIAIETSKEQPIVNLVDNIKAASISDQKEEKKAVNDNRHMIVVVKGPSHQEVHFKVNKATKFKEVSKCMFYIS